MTRPRASGLGPRLAALLMLVTAVALAVPPADEFFIISSVDAPRSRIVVKRPNETTMVVRVTPQTAITGERSEKLALHDLRAGDTIYAVIASGTAVRIRRGPMTVDELRRRYLPGLWHSAN